MSRYVKHALKAHTLFAILVLAQASAMAQNPVPSAGKNSAAPEATKFETYHAGPWEQEIGDFRRCVPARCSSCQARLVPARESPLTLTGK